MRPLQLEIEAFGSYAGVERVDFEVLGQLGLFLVTGPTGSGKTTIFDALVFALYGTVPGSRRAEEVHSHHAAPGSTPRVVLELEADGTRWRIERTAKHERPVRRGAGTTTEQPTAAMWRWQAGEWLAVASGLRDVNATVIDRIGLTAEQFQRVVLLPQGDFEQFLVARSDDRKVLLRQLFGTEVYERAVEALRRAAAEARHAADAAGARHRQQVEALGHHLDQAELLTGSLTFEEAPVLERLRRLGRAVTEAGEHQRRAGSIAAAAERDLAAAQAVAARWAARERRRDERDRLEAGRAAHEADVAALDAARRARPVRDLAAPAQRHARRAAEAAAVAERARSAFAGSAADVVGWASPELRDLLVVAISGGSPAGATTSAEATEVESAAGAAGAVGAAGMAGSVTGVRRAALAEHERWRHVADRWRALDAAARALAASAAVEEERAAAVEVADAAVRRADAEVVASDAEWQAGREVASGLDTLRAAAEDAERVHRQASALAGATAELRAATVAAAAAESAHRAGFDRFVHHAAPRLAAELRAGEACPVCGGVDHPLPAEPDPTAPAVSAEQLDRLRADAATAAQHRDRLAGQVARLQAELGAAAEVPASVLADRSAAAAAEVVACERAQAEAEAAQQRLAAARRAADRARTAAVEAAAALAVASAEVGRCRQQHDAVAAELVAAAPAGDAAERIVHLADLVDLADALEPAEQAAAAARAAADTAADALRDAVAAGRWADAEEALAVALDDPAIDRIARSVDTWERAWQAVTAQLAADDAELPVDPPDVVALEAFAADAAARRVEAAERHTALTVHVDLAQRAHERLSSVERDAAAALDAAEAAATVHERCAGQLAPKVSLESWVLGAELDRVVDAANAHLEEMTSGRYRLARVTDTTDARVSTGLDLVVDDAYTGTSRRTTSLSGGERFQASLALALGLADVVTAGATATARTLDALFVDEGFGSLDAAALDQAIATLDRLRVHGRQIGVITHVEAMQSALPVGVRVERLPGEAGSRILQTVTAG